MAAGVAGSGKLVQGATAEAEKGAKVAAVPEQQIHSTGDGVKILKTRSEQPFIENPSIEANSVSETVAAARLRQSAMLKDNIGFNISPTAWDAYPTIGRNGTFVSDRRGIMNYFGDTAGGIEIKIPYSTAVQIEQDIGLVPGTLQDGFKVRQVTEIRDMLPASPLEGNQYFLGAGNHLPGGAPEMMIKSIPTIDNEFVKTLLNVKVRQK